MYCPCGATVLPPSLGVLQERYPEVEPFTRRMLDELWANRDKGDQPAWRAMSIREAWGEISWHHAKLAGAIKAQDAALVRELCADVANGAMMLADILDQMESPDASGA